jgi:glycosyltransferase involved in cell wall biosynthesis
MNAATPGKLRVLLVHNFYQEPGGEDEVFARERELLERAGHAVCVYTRRNEEIGTASIAEKISLPLRTVWAWDSARAIRELIRREKPNVAHFHNTFPLISPAAYQTCQEEGVAVVQSLHNPRLMCPAATFHRDGRECQACLGKRLAWPGVMHACYRGSRAETAAVATMLALHRRRGTWRQLVDRYIVSTQFYRRLFIRAGLPQEKLQIKPHFVPTDPGVSKKKREYALFVGRLAPEKGVSTLLKAWVKLPAIPLKVRGEGRLLGDVQAFARDHAVEIVPRLSRGELVELFHGARFLVWPSEGLYETFGLVAAEAFACGVPVIASGTGVMAEMVHDHQTGLHFVPGNPDDLAKKAAWAWWNPEEMERMGHAARAEYETKYRPEPNYNKLMNIYFRAVAKPYGGVPFTQEFMNAGSAEPRGAAAAPFPTLTA